MHLNLEFASLIGRARYEALCQHRGTLLSEWLFSEAAFRESVPPSGTDLLEDSEFGLTAPALGLEADEAKDWFLRLRSVLVPAYLEALVGSRDWADYDIVSFTSTFQQNVASFALCRLLKERVPGTVSLFGGANFDGTMGLEYMRSLEFIDYAAIGEADTSFPAFLMTYERGGDLTAVPGIAARHGPGDVRLKGEAKPFQGLDSLPIPDYADYFERAGRLGFFAQQSRTTVDLPFESARGCWWGQKHHCIFCGLNAKTMTYRSKSPQRVLDELNALSGRYRSLSLEAVDNILDLSYLSTLLPRIAEEGFDWNIFYETKSNLSIDDLELLARAGVKRLQPGIESLSTPLLQTMRKGITGLRNINLLKWCRHFGITVSWNFLWGFLGETREHYVDQIPKLRAIVHLQPPDGEGRLWLERFSPMFNDQSTFGVGSVRPLGSYAYVYPQHMDLEEAAYFFEYEMRGALPDSVFADVTAVLEDWRRAWREGSPPYLRCRLGPEFVEIEEGRPGRERGTFLLEGALAAVYRTCLRRPVSINVIAEASGETGSTVEEALAAFDERGLVIREDRSALALATT
jgi:ribosomal peptide maturation radical SAM protein 1